MRRGLVRVVRRAAGASHTGPAWAAAAPRVSELHTCARPGGAAPAPGRCWRSKVSRTGAVCGAQSVAGAPAWGTHALRRGVATGARAQLAVAQAAAGDDVPDLLAGDLGMTIEGGSLLATDVVGDDLLAGLDDVGGGGGAAAELLVEHQGELDDLPDVVLSASAAQRILALQASRGKPDLRLRTWVDDGGCSGYTYMFELVDRAPLPSEREFTRDGASVLVDVVSMPLLAGATVDMEQSLMKQGFSIVANPNAEKGCGCGTSFAVRMD